MTEICPKCGKDTLVRRPRELCRYVVECVTCGWHSLVMIDDKPLDSVWLKDEEEKWR